MDNLLSKVRIFDKPGKHMDRYTVIYPDRDARAMSSNALSGQGVCLWIGTDYDLNHLGSEIDISDAPDAVQRAIRLDLQEFYM